MASRKDRPSPPLNLEALEIRLVLADLSRALSALSLSAGGLTDSSRAELRSLVSILRDTGTEGTKVAARLTSIQQQTLSDGGRPCGT